MNEHPKYLYTVTYMMERRDYVALSRVLTRQKPARVAIELALYFGALLALVAISAGSPERFLGTLVEILTTPALVFYMPLILLGPLLLLATPWITGLIAAAIYRRNAIADREVTLHLTAEGIEGGATDLYSRIGWAAVIRLTETPTHLFIQISRREAIFMPRRAIPNEDHYNNLKGFIRARTGLSTFA
jgi:hypothetical protein